MKLLIATRNKHKLEEIRALFAWPGLEVVSALDFPDVPDVIEDRATFAGNAIKKAEEFADATGLWSMADDSGLEVTALDGAPGIYSARYAGDHATDIDNNARLLEDLRTATDRSAAFCCVVALVNPEGLEWTVEGRCSGHLLKSPRGGSGFGYDPLFVPDGYKQTFAELGPEIKNRISHRAKALAAARESWTDLLASSSPPS